MNDKDRSWRRAPLPVLLALAVLLAPLPAMAGEPPAAAAGAPGIAAAAHKAVAAQVTAGKPSLARAQTNTGTRTDLGSTSFFKSPAGIITLVVAGAGLGYAVYSTSHDRLNSPGR